MSVAVWLYGCMAVWAVCRYQEANARNQALQEQQAQKNGELEQLRERRDRLLADCRSSALRMEAVRLHEQQAELDARREALEKELREQRTPAEERDRLLTQLKADNQETALLERQIAEASQQLEQVQDQLRNLEQESDEALQLGTRFFSLLCSILLFLLFTCAFLFLFLFLFQIRSSF